MSKGFDLLCKNIQAEMSRQNLSPSELARRSGLSPAYISQVLGGINKNPGLTQLEAFAAGLRTSIGKLLADSSEQPSIMDSIRTVTRLLQDLDANPHSALVEELWNARPPKSEK